LFLFVATPLLLFIFRSEIGRAFILLLIVAGIATYIFLKKREVRLFYSLEGIRVVLYRFLLLTPMIFLFAYFIDSERFLYLPLERPFVWIAIMFLYPLLSVFPQELIFRSYMFERYGAIFSGKNIVYMSAFAFGFMHIIFGNFIAFFMTIFGGYLFASTYYRSRSILLVSIEHALYGDVIFTSGLGYYFFTGAIK